MLDHTSDEILRALDRVDLSVVARLPENWHGDRHWLVADSAGARFSLRAVTLGREIRWEDARVHSADVIRAQLAAGAQLAVGVPFMRLDAGPVVVDDAVVVLFAWCEGETASRSTSARAFAIGRAVRAVHDLALTPSPNLPVHDLVAMAARSIDELGSRATASFRARADDLMHAAARRETIVIHGDWNFPNVLWHDADIVGLVDFDQIGAGDPAEELAWVVKWWSRPEMMGSHRHDRALARAVLDGYGAHDVDRTALAARLWISGCLNANSVKHVQRGAPLDALIARADALAGLV